MNILITGATGFIGSRILQLKNRLFRAEDNVILLTSHETDGFTCILHKEYTYTKEDFYDKKIYNIDGVIYLGHFLKELHPDMNSVEGNISSVNNVMHLMDNLPGIPQIFVFCSSMAVYGDHRADLVDEDSELKIQNEYSASKYLMEQYLKGKCGKQGINLHILRLSHIYGPGDKRKYTIPIWLQAKKNKQAIRLFTNPVQKRNCLYIDDCCRFIVNAVYLKEKAEIINVVSEHNSSMKEISELCKRISGNSEDIIIEGYYPENVGVGFSNCKKRKDFLGEENFSLQQGLENEYHYFVGVYGDD